MCQKCEDKKKAVVREMMTQPEFHLAQELSEKIEVVKDFCVLHDIPFIFSAHPPGNLIKAASGGKSIYTLLGLNIDMKLHLENLLEYMQLAQASLNTKGIAEEIYKENTSPHGSN